MSDVELLTRLLDTHADSGLKYLATTPAEMRAAMDLEPLRHVHLLSCHVCRKMHEWTETQIRAVAPPGESTAYPCVLCKSLHVITVIQDPAASNLLVTWTLATPKPEELETDATWAI